MKTTTVNVMETKRRKNKMWPFSKKSDRPKIEENRGKRGKILGDPGIFDLEYDS